MATKTAKTVGLGPAGRAMTIPVTRGDARWLIDAAWTEALLGRDSPNWFALEKDRRAACVKNGLGRKTWRVALGGVTIYAKVFESGGIIDTVFAWIAGTPAYREWKGSRAAALRAVPVAGFVAVGASHGYEQRSALLSEGLKSAIPLSIAWERDVTTVRGAARRRRAAAFIHAVARLYATSHQRGFAHHDGHPANILLYADDLGETSATFVDVRAACLRRTGPVSSKQAIRSLAQLEQYFRLRASAAERLRFLREYVRILNPGEHESYTTSPRARCKEMAREIRGAALSQARRLARRRDRRLRRQGPYFARLRLADGWRATACLKIARRHLFPEAHIPDRSIKDWRPLLEECLESAASVSAGPIDGVRQLQKCGLHCELICSSTRTEKIKWTLLGSPARREFERTHQLRHRDVSAPLVLGYAERRRRGLIEEAVIIRPE